MKSSANFLWLSFVPFSKFDLWDTKRYTSKQFESSFPIVRLGECIREENKKYKLSTQPEKEFGILGVSNKVGIFDAYLQKGKEINQSYKKMKIGWIAYNPYRINVGSIGVRKSEHLFEYISPAYVVFSCKENLLPEFLFLLFRTETFNKVINENTTGSVRQNLTVEILKNLEIPLPTLDEQRKIVDAYERKINEAKTLELNAENLESEIERYLFEELGVQLAQKSNNHKGLQFINFTDIERWDILFLMGQVDQIGSKYKIKKFAKVITSFNKGQDGKSLRIDSSKFPQSDFRYIGMEHIEKKTGTLLELQNVKGGEIKSQTINVPRNFMIYGKLRPYLNKYWVNNTGFDNIICSSEFFVFDIDEEKLDKSFFKYVLASEIIQSQINDKTSGARMPRINEEIFFNLHFPMPDIQEQLKISQKISSMKTEIELNKEKAKNLRVSAEEEFEKTIFQ